MATMRLESLFISFTAFFVFSDSIRAAIVRYVRKIAPASPSKINSLSWQRHRPVRPCAEEVMARRQ